MDLLSFSIVYLIIGIFIINFLVILFIRSNERLLITAVSLWALMFMVVIVLTIFNNNNVDLKEIEYSGPVTMTEEEFEELDSFKQQAKYENKKLVRLLGIQTVISFIWLLLGLRTTTKKYYRSALLSFAAFSFIYAIIELFWLLG
jgi:hypothetical protein